MTLACLVVPTQLCKLCSAFMIVCPDLPPLHNFLPWLVLDPFLPDLIIYALPAWFLTLICLPSKAFSPACFAWLPALPNFLPFLVLYSCLHA
jgi:hypothetical protein